MECQVCADSDGLQYLEIGCECGRPAGGGRWICEDFGGRTGGRLSVGRRPVRKVDGVRLLDIDQHLGVTELTWAARPTSADSLLSGRRRRAGKTLGQRAVGQPLFGHGQALDVVPRSTDNRPDSKAQVVDEM